MQLVQAVFEQTAQPATLQLIASQVLLVRLYLNPGAQMLQAILPAHVMQLVILQPSSRHPSLLSVTVLPGPQLRHSVLLQSVQAASYLLAQEMQNSLVLLATTGPLKKKLGQLASQLVSSSLPQGLHIDYSLSK
jgi:hypothetical protein